MNKIPLIIDTDPGIDDAAALIAAYGNPKFDIKLITSVFGNVDIDKTTNNALKIVELMGKDTKVAKGAKEAIFFKNIIDASQVHGQTGMAGYDFPEPKQKIYDKVAIEAIKEVLEVSKDKVTIVALGALTNIALFLKVYPHLSNKIKEIVIMGGSLSGGNTNTVAEFNIYNDPHAAKIVFDSNVRKVIFGLDITRRCTIKPEGLEILEKSNKVSNICYRLFKNYRSEGFSKGLIMHDSTTIAYLDRPDIFKYEEKYIDVATEGAAIGSFVADYYTIRNKENKVNVVYAVDVNEKEFERWIIQSLTNTKDV